MNGGKGKIQVHSRVSQGGQDAKAVKNEGIISKFARCAWQAFVWMPIFWPLWISMWMLSPLIGRGGRGKQPDGDEAGDDKDDSRKLSTQGSLGLFIIIAAVVLRVGDIVAWIMWGWLAVVQEARAEVQELMTPEMSFHTPPSSPPPFDAISGEKSPPHKPVSPAGPTLRERLRNLGQTISVIRRFGSAGFVSSRPVTSSISHKPRDQADFRLGINRSMRTYNLFEEIKNEYEKAEEGLKLAGGNREQVYRALHERSARKVLELCRTNGGLYTKAAQFVASLQGGAGDKGIPKEYADILRVLTDSAPFRPLKEMEQVLREDFDGKGCDDLFHSIEEEPIAAASLAQVHRAVLHNGQHVAVKMMYPTLKKEMASDFAMFRRLGSQIQPGGYDLGWMVQDFEDAIKCELDLESEARNSEITGNIFQGRQGVVVPKVVWELTRENVLTMEYVPGLLRVSEPEVIEANNLSLLDCGEIVSDTLAEMALCWGHVHGDPHAGNIYVCAGRSGMLAGLSPKVVLLDHGLYHDVDDVLRLDLCRLFNACIARNRPEILRLSERIAGPMHRFLPLLLSPWFILGTDITWEDLDAAKNNKLPPSITSKDVGTALEALHNNGGVILGVLHSFGYTRGLLNSLSFPERRRLKSISTYATLGLLPPDIMERALREGLHTLPLRLRLKILWNSMQVDMNAVLLRILSITLCPELDGTRSLDVCIVLADCILEVGRFSLLKAVAGFIGLADRHEIWSGDAAGDANPSQNRTEVSGDEEDDGDSESDECMVKETDEKDVTRGRKRNDNAAIQGERPGRWQAAMSQVKMAVESHAGEEQPAGVRGWARRTVGRLVKKAINASRKQEDREGSSSGNASPEATQPGKTRRKRHYSPSRRGAQGRPWV